MKTVEQLRSQLSLGEFGFSRHALKRTVERNISEQEIRQAERGKLWSPARSVMPRRAERR